MIVVILSACPPKLRGDMTRWMMEVDTGVYVANLSARVRDALWDRITENIGTGRALMVFSTNTEQRFDVRVCNTKWTPIDLDGIRLLKRPIPERRSAQKDRSGKRELPHYWGLEVFSGAAKPKTPPTRRGRKPGEKARRSSVPTSEREGYIAYRGQAVTEYCAVDIETGGLLPKDDPIIEMAALRVRSGEIVDRFSTLIRCDRSIPTIITELTGLTEELLQRQGIPLEQALVQLLSFVADDIMIAHNAPFDIDFISEACIRCGLPPFRPQFMDTLLIARETVSGVANYKLDTLLKELQISDGQRHRALPDAEDVAAVFEKLKMVYGEMRR